MGESESDFRTVPLAVIYRRELNLFRKSLNERRDPHFRCYMYELDLEKLCAR